MAKFTTTITVDCPHCKSGAVVKNGRGRGQQEYKCRGCNRKFRNNGTAYNRQIPAAAVGAAVGMYYDGLSYKRTAENLSEIFEIPEPSKASVYEWIRDYSELDKREMEKHKARTGPEWVADESTVTVNGRKLWNWNVMDASTRYLLASHLSVRRNMRAAIVAMRKARANSVNPPKRIKTDRLNSYIDAIERVFGADVEHVQSEGITAELNNTRSERLQGSFRDREKVLRGLQSVETAQRYLDTWVLNYNLFRPHESLKGKTPAEVAGIRVPFKEWEDFANLDAAEFSRRRRQDEREYRPRDKTFRTSRRRGGF